MNPIDIFFGLVQGTVAAILLLRINNLPDIALYFLVAMLVISGLMDIFDM